MRRFLAVLIATFLLHASGAFAQYNVLPYPSPIPMFAGPWDASQGMGMMNQMISELDNFLGPVFPAVPGSVNSIQIIASTSGNPVQINSAGADANIAIGVNPKGNGNIILFSGGSMDTGLLQIANASNWFQAKGLTACPGVPPGNPYTIGSLIGPSSAITSYIPIQDWIGRVRWQVAC